MKHIIFISFLLILTVNLTAQIAVTPTSINVNSQDATNVPLTFGPIPAGYTTVDSVWCGSLTPSGGIGQTCRADTIYGSLPQRHNQSQRRTLSNGGEYLFDVMAVPASVTRRAYQTAQSGGSATFFYVRRFVSSNGNPDIFVSVACRMGGGGARTPFTVTSVRIRTPDEKPILFLKSGKPLPPIYYEIHYNGTGTLRGRWELVQPGEEVPSDFDLLPEAALPIDRRGTQKLYTQLSRFDVFLPPSGRYLLPAPESIPNYVEGQYFLLLRLEPAFDKETENPLPIDNTPVVTPTPTPTPDPCGSVGASFKSSVSLNATNPCCPPGFIDNGLGTCITNSSVGIGADSFGEGNSITTNAVPDIDGTINYGGSAAFPFPFLRIQVGAFNDRLSWIKNGLIPKTINQASVLNINPQNRFETLEGDKLVLNNYSWYELKDTDVYLVEFVNEADTRLLAAYIPLPRMSYYLPKILRERFRNKRVYWRVSALKKNGKLIARTDRQRIM